MAKEKELEQVEGQQLPVENKVGSLIRVIRGQQVMLDRDLAELYGVETRMRHFMVNNVAFYLFNEKVPSGRNATWNLT